MFIRTSPRVSEYTGTHARAHISRRSLNALVAHLRIPLTRRRGCTSRKDPVRYVYRPRRIRIPTLTTHTYVTRKFLKRGSSFVTLDSCCFDGETQLPNELRQFPSLNRGRLDRRNFPNKGNAEFSSGFAKVPQKRIIDTINATNTSTTQIRRFLSSVLDRCSSHRQFLRNRKSAGPCRECNKCTDR